MRKRTARAPQSPRRAITKKALALLLDVSREPDGVLGVILQYAARIRRKSHGTPEPHVRELLTKEQYRAFLRGHRECARYAARLAGQR